MDHLPAAPTPPVNNGNMGSNQDRTSNLLSLLKFGGSGNTVAQQRQSQPPQQQQHHQSIVDEQQSPPPQQLHSPPQPPEHQQNHHQSLAHHHADSSFHGSHHSLGLQQQPQFPTRIHQPAPAAADPTGLLAALMRGAQDGDNESTKDQSSPAPPPPQQLAHQQPPSAFSNESPSADTRSFLLNLLNRPKPLQNEQQPLLTESSRSNNHTPQSSSEIDQSQILAQYKQSQDPYAAAKQYQQSKMYGESGGHHQSQSGEPVHYSSSQQDPAEASALYQHLMGSLSNASPQSNAGQSANAGPAFHILKEHASPGSQHAGSHHAGSQYHGGSHHGSQHGSHRGSLHSGVTSPNDLTRRKSVRAQSMASHHSASKPTPNSTDFERYVAPEHHKELVSEPIHDKAHKGDRSSYESLDRTDEEQEQTHEDIASELDKMLDADSDQEFHQRAQVVAEALEKELDRSDNEGVLEEILPVEEVEAVRSVIHEAAAENVADSWESADQDEIVVIEEKEPTPVRVFNFPMKPWISITLNEGTTDPRPEFRDEATMDIARLKKEFDQIDRNLYTASANYMTYGMSKQGGLRVIRQDDGKDAKVFTDTKDRIFNVAMSVTPSDHNGTHKEAIIGTGISGTVYWVQIRDGEKDHIEDAHLEQYGFALPPMNSSEGDTPGGVLKTRARASTIHPEFFAVGRGKSINFIWPSYILQNNLLKPGHDRAVDTDTLSQNCSLKINTGKAGKDFTFSQDDTVVVSLDKSGRVKFWDVRDLTATKEGCDPRNPIPEHTSLEVKEPLMTLASTPEGEKAWPTSVLLLDKQRPYQKRCALRYMIVGMKQNHTLQLWDLALGKPVQEFNLPHSKESDAVCSVMYHPSSGMIVIGHPTRNSIYFAHLSAPKYNLKSVTQAEYIQRLVAQDSSIPQPDSTAVISGVREYSFENRGNLRSLDILSNPAMVQDTDEPTLFELYAMHSKGVACLLIKQQELGWSKDNKVLYPVEAVDEGIVSVSKLKSPQPIETSPDSSSHARNGTRGPTKETPQPATSNNHAAQPQNDIVARGSEAVTPVKNKIEPKEAETPVPSKEKENQADKPERKPRKKKGNANQLEATTNGASGSHGQKEAPKGLIPMPNGVTSEAFDTAVAGLERRLSANLNENLKSSLKNLHVKIDEGIRTRDEEFNNHQVKLLDMVSEVLNENTQKVLEALVHQKFTELVIPAIGDKAGRAVSELLNNKLQPNVANSVQKEIQTALPHALNRSLRSGEFMNSISDRVSASMSSTIQKEVVGTLTSRLSSSFSTIANQSTQHVVGEIHQHYAEQFEAMQAQRVADSAKIDQLMTQVRQLTDVVSTIASTQQSLQAEFLKLRQQPPVHELPGVPGPQNHVGGAPSMGHHSYGGHSISNKPSSTGYPASQAASHGQPYHNNHMGSPHYVRGGGPNSQLVSSPQGSVAPSEQVPVPAVSTLAGAFANQRNKSEAEVDHELQQRIRIIEQAIQEGRLQEAMIQWIQSGRETEIFQRCLCRYSPSRFDSLPPLMLLVVIATISKDLKPNPRLKEEIEWIEMAVRTFGENIPSYEWEQQGFREVIQSALQTLQLLVNKVRPFIEGIQDGYPTDPFLANLERSKLEWIVRTSEHIAQSFSGIRHYD
ncbi:unnamed protein product [Clonostachys byssicola]|uniref:EDC4-like protein pdc1 beta-propeller domain-containing protein n=1 Tax=Clonostachys byssicola TaxID=160290 RepID=A0A9N9UX89_9HYPO|nr:unnamed protein product [Clonostachys byssicola]